MALKKTSIFNMTQKDVTVTPKKEMFQERYSFGITYDEKNKEVYVFGGANGYDTLNHCEKYSLEKNEWTVLEPMA